jgi:hypothetical protein
MRCIFRRQPPEECAAIAPPVDPKPPRDVAAMPDDGADVDDDPVELEREKNERDEEPPAPPLPDDDEPVERQDSLEFGEADIAAPGAGCAPQSLRGIIA